MNYLRPDLLRALARDHALGTMTGGARRRFDRLLREQPQARAALAGWHAVFAPLAAEVPEVQPREAVWQRLEQRLFGGPAAQARGAQPAGRSWWPRWLGVPVGALAGALVAGVALQQNPGWIGHEAMQEALPQSYVGLLSDAAGKPAVLASSRRHGRTLTVKMLQPVEPPAGTVARLWALPRDGSAPVALGAVPARGSATIALPDTSERLFFTVERLAVSFEPGPTGTGPTQPYVVSGPCVKLW